MKVYFLKSNLEQYQIFPKPSNPNNWVEYDIENEDILNHKQLVSQGDEYRLVNKAPNNWSEWNGSEWITDKQKYKELVAQKTIELTESIDETAYKISSRWTRFTTEYEQREKAAKAFIDGEFKGDAGIYVTSFSDAAKLTPKAAAQLIMKQAEGLRQLQAQLAVQRMRKYELKADGLSIEQMQSIHDDIINKMQKLAEAQQ